MVALQLIAGLVLLGFGADWLVRGASRLALAAGLTPLVIGLTVVAFGTSMPELVTSVVAGYAGQPTIALTNIIGSNIGNIGLILATAAVLKSLSVQSVMIRRDLPMMLIASLMFAAALVFGIFQGVVAGLFLLAVVGFTIWQIRSSKVESAAVQAEFEEEIAGIEGAAVRWPVWLAAVVTLAGLGTLIFGGRLLVESAVTIAEALGVSERVIGLTIVALGTSLPELAATLVAVLRGEPDVAVGNVVGSNIFNILFIGGIVGLSMPSLTLPPGLLIDLGIMCAVSLVACWMLLTQQRMSRPEGLVMLSAYGVYVGWLVVA